MKSSPRTMAFLALLMAATLSSCSFLPLPTGSAVQVRLSLRDGPQSRSIRPDIVEYEDLESQVINAPRYQVSIVGTAYNDTRTLTSLEGQVIPLPGPGAYDLEVLALDNNDMAFARAWSPKLFLDEGTSTIILRFSPMRRTSGSGTIKVRLPLYEWMNRADEEPYTPYRQIRMSLQKTGDNVYEYLVDYDLVQDQEYLWSSPYGSINIHVTRLQDDGFGAYNGELELSATLPSGDYLFQFAVYQNIEDNPGLDPIWAVETGSMQTHTVKVYDYRESTNLRRLRVFADPPAVDLSGVDINYGDYAPGGHIPIGTNLSVKFPFPETTADLYQFDGLSWNLTYHRVPVPEGTRVYFPMSENDTDLTVHYSAPSLSAPPLFVNTPLNGTLFRDQDKEWAKLVVTEVGLYTVKNLSHTGVARRSGTALTLALYDDAFTELVERYAYDGALVSLDRYLEPGTYYVMFTDRYYDGPRTFSIEATYQPAGTPLSLPLRNHGYEESEPGYAPGWELDPNTLATFDSLGGEGWGLEQGSALEYSQNLMGPAGAGYATKSQTLYLPGLGMGPSALGGSPYLVYTEYLAQGGPDPDEFWMRVEVLDNQGTVIYSENNGTEAEPLTIDHSNWQPYTAYIVGDFSAAAQVRIISGARGGEAAGHQGARIDQTQLSLNPEF